MARSNSDPRTRPTFVRPSNFQMQRTPPELQAHATIHDHSGYEAGSSEAVREPAKEGSERASDGAPLLKVPWRANRAQDFSERFLTTLSGGMPKSGLVGPTSLKSSLACGNLGGESKLGVQRRTNTTTMHDATQQTHACNENANARL